MLSAAPCVHDARPRIAARQLAALGHDVRLICRATPDAPAEEQVGKARLSRVDFDDLAPLAKATSIGLGAKLLVRALAFGRRLIVRRSWASFSRLLALCQEFLSISAVAESRIEGPVDAVHAVGLAALPAAGRMAALKNALLIYDAIELERDRNANYFRPFYWLRLHLERRWLKRSHAFVAPSEEIALQMMRDFGRPRPRVVHNVSMEEADDTDVRAHIGLPESAPLAVYVGSALRSRGLAPSIQAMGRLPDWNLAVVGPNPELFSSRFADHIAAAGAVGRVWPIAARPPAKAAAFIATADVAAVMIEPACASYEFALPNKLFQSVVAGVPVVVGRTAALRRVAAPERLGEPVDERDADALAAAFRRQAGRKCDPAYRAARAKFLSRHDLSAATVVWAQVYADAIRAGVDGPDAGIPPS